MCLRETLVTTGRTAAPGVPLSCRPGGLGPVKPGCRRRVTEHGIWGSAGRWGRSQDRVTHTQDEGGGVAGRAAQATVAKGLTGGLPA